VPLRQPTISRGRPLCGLVAYACVCVSVCVCVCVSVCVGVSCVDVTHVDEVAACERVCGRRCVVGYLYIRVRSDGISDLPEARVSGIASCFGGGSLQHMHIGCAVQVPHPALTGGRTTIRTAHSPTLTLAGC